MKTQLRSLCSLAILAGSALVAAGSSAAGLDDVVLASVNEEQITRGSLAQRLIEERGEEALQKYVNRVLVNQEAKKLGLSITPQEAAARFAELKSRFRNEQAYEQFLKASNLSEKQLIDEAKTTLLVQKVALHNDPLRPEELVRYDIRMLVAPDKPTAEKWVKDLQNGGNFTTMASERGADIALRETGGRMELFLRVGMIDVADAIIQQKLQPGQFTRTPVLLAERWVLIKLENLIPISSASPAERERLEAQVTAFRVDRWFEDRRAKAKIEKKSLADPTVAIVNGEALTRSSMVSRLLEFQGEETLEKMVNRALLLQTSRKLQVNATDAEAEARLKEFKAQFKGDAAFSEFLARSNVNERQMRDEFRFTVLLEKIVGKESPVTDADLQRYDVRLIEAPDRTTGEKWIKDLDGGADFEKMAKERSVDPQGRPVGGRMKPFIKLELLDIWRVLDDAKLKPGQYTKSPNLLSDGSWAILKLEGVQPASSLAAADRERLSKVVMNYRMAMWPAQARRSATISFPIALKTVIEERA